MKLSIFYSTLLVFTVLNASTNANVVHTKVKKINHPHLIKGRYILEVADHASVDKLAEELTTNFAPQDLHIRRRFKHDIFSGLSFQLNENINYHKQLSTILDNDYVLTAYPSMYHKKSQVEDTHKNNSTITPDVNTYVPLTKPADIDTVLPHHLTQVDRVHKELSLYGNGITIAVLDTGVDYNHPALGGGFGEGFKISFGADLAGDHSDENKLNPTPLDACNTFTADGHGTHVLGIIAAEYENFIGIAPKAKMGMYRVFDCEGVSPEDAILDGFLKADEAGADIISASLGSNIAWEQSPSYEVISRIVQKGKYVIAAAGNEGEGGLYTVNQPGASKGVFSIASYQNAYEIVKFFEASSINEQIDFSSPNREINTKYANGELVLGRISDDCHISNDIKNKYVYLQVDEGKNCTFSDQMAYLEQNGAYAAIYYISKESKVDTSFGANIPGLTITEEKHAIHLSEYLSQHGKVSVNFTGQYAKPVKDVGKVSVFSSLGPTYDLDVQPHLGGIGGRVYSTLPVYLNSWGEMDGTSMATPYLSGCIALYLEYARKNGHTVTPEYVREQFQNYALPVTSSNEEILLDTPIRQGAGLVQLYNTIIQKNHISPAFISFNDTASTTEYKSHILTITNNGNNPVNYQISNKPSQSVQPYNLKETDYRILKSINYGTLSAKLFISQSTIQVQPQQSVQVKVTVVPPKGDDHSMYGGYIYFKSSDEKINDISVPYFGAIGRQKDIPIIGQVRFSNSPDYQPVDEKEPFVLDANADNSILFYLNIGTPSISFDLFNKQSNQTVGTLSETSIYASHIMSNSQPIPFNNTYIPNGSTERDIIPKGTYQIIIRALRIFGDPTISSDYDTWVTQDIIVPN
ncbi:unnamed protein product [Cunninghamella blakesleeana]